MRLLYLTTVVIALFTQGYAMADTKKSDPLTKLDDATKKIMTGMSENHLRQLAAIRNTHGVIQAVDDVEDNLTAAVKNCSTLHQDLSGPLTGRFNAWRGTIDPIIEDARQRLNMMVKLQDFAKPEEARKYLKMVDDAVAYKARGVKAVPIKEHKECERLIDTLDDTEKDLKKSLVENLGLNRPLVQDAQ